MYWNGGKDGVDVDGIPFYGSFEFDDSDERNANVVSIPGRKDVKEVKNDGNSRNHAA